MILKINCGKYIKYAILLLSKYKIPEQTTLRIKIFWIKSNIIVPVVFCTCNKTDIDLIFPIKIASSNSALVFALLCWKNAHIMIE